MQADDIDGYKGVVQAMAASGDPDDDCGGGDEAVFRAQGGERDEQEIPAMPSRPPDAHRPIPRYGAPSHDRHRETPGRQTERPHVSRAPRGAGREAGMARVYVGAGRESGIRPGDLVGAIANEAKVNSNVIGAILIEERFSVVDVPETMVKGIVEVLGRARIKGRKVQVRLFRE